MRCVRGDLLDLEPDRRYDLWHDRAVFHFLVSESERERYVERLRRTAAPGAGVIVGTFADDGPEMCSGLPVRRYTASDLASALGDTFDVVERRREEHVTPRGVTQPFTWVAGWLASDIIAGTHSGGFHDM